MRTLVFENNVENMTNIKRNISIDNQQFAIFFYLNKQKISFVKHMQDQLSNCSFLVFL